MCPKCGETKPVTEFYHSKGTISSYCKACHKVVTRDYARRNPKLYSEAQTKWYHANKDKSKCASLRRQYGISLKEYHELAAKQGDRCAICNTDDKTAGQAIAEHWCVDHDHETGKVRGLLCNYCNRALGHMKDDPSLLRKAAAYLEHHTQPHAKNPT